MRTIPSLLWNIARIVGPQNCSQSGKMKIFRGPGPDFLLSTDLSADMRMIIFSSFSFDTFRVFLTPSFILFQAKVKKIVSNLSKIREKTKFIANPKKDESSIFRDFVCMKFQYHYFVKVVSEVSGFYTHKPSSSVTPEKTNL